MKARKDFSEREWEEIASFLSKESKDRSETIDSFLDGEGQLIQNYWNNMETNRMKDTADVDKAWNALYKRLEEDKLISNSNNRVLRINRLIRVAAVVVILAGLSLTFRMVVNNNPFTSTQSVVALADQARNVIDLDDGSRVYLNRESQLNYPSRFGKRNRKVTLTGEAFFEIAPDTDRPFIIDANSASIRVVGTSFNVITSNDDDLVEVFVATGKVLLTSSDGNKQLSLEPGYIGKINNELADKTMNEDPNYIAWNTEILTFDGTTLDRVFNDLEEVYNLKIEVRSDDILDHRFTSTFNKNSPDTIIQLICTTFNLKCEKVGDTYYLTR